MQHNLKLNHDLIPFKNESLLVQPSHSHTMQIETTSPVPLWPSKGQADMQTGDKLKEKPEQKSGETYQMQMQPCTSAHWMVWWVWKCFTPIEDFGPTCKTMLSTTTISKTPNDINFHLLIYLVMSVTVSDAECPFVMSGYVCFFFLAAVSL